uniref:Uncharacterized protein n=1 Tax=Populus trichocarpa TaxID=3694 RepID=A0A3N7FJN6_POPTR
MNSFLRKWHHIQRIVLYYIKEFSLSGRYNMLTIGQMCPHRLVVQDISLSRRQRGVNFPWG